MSDNHYDQLEVRDVAQRELAQFNLLPDLVRLAGQQVLRPEADEGVRRLDEHKQLRPSHPDGTKGSQGNKGEVVLALTEGASDPFRHADDAERNTGQHDFLGCRHRVRFASAAFVADLPERGDVVDVDAEFEHGQKLH